MSDVVAKFSLSEENNIDAIFKIDAAGTTWGSIDGTLSNQTDLQAALDLKADKSTVEADFEALSDTVTENYTTLDAKIDSVQSDLSGDIIALSSTVTSNNTAVNNRIDTTNSNLSALQTTVNDNNTAINNRVNTLETSFDADIEELNTHLSDLSDTVGDNYTNLSDQISETNVNFAALSTTVSSNYTTLDNKINGVNSELSGNIGELETGLTELTTTVANNNTAINQKVDTLETTLSGDINTLSGTVSSNYTIINTKIDNTKTDLEGDITTLSGTVTTNYNDLNSAITTSSSTINSRIDSEVDNLNAAITSEAITRANADNNLQSQIDAITSASDVVDIVGTYAALQAYDTSNLQNNDIIKVLSDESRDDETTYYRWVITDGVGAWFFIGEEGPYYTKSEADTQFVPQTRTINNKALSANITLTASDVNALPDTTVIGDGVLTLQKNGVNIDTFNANSTTNKTINIDVPTVLSELTNDEGFITDADLSDIETSVENNTANITALSGRVDTAETALNSKADTSNIPTKTSDLTNDSGFITDAALEDYATTTDLTNGLATKQNTLTSENAGTGISIENGIISNTQTSAEWGNITGTLSNQADLQNALNTKQDTISDLADIRRGAVSGSTAVQPATLENYVPQTQFATTEQYGIVKPDGNSVYIYDGKLTAIQRNIGEIVTSLLPLTDAGLHLLDGALLQGDGIYAEFVEYIAKLYAEGTASNCFTIETLWQESVSTYGECGKFVYDSENNTVRLPKISGILEGTTDIATLGDLVEAGLPNITGTVGYFMIGNQGSTGYQTGVFSSSTSALHSGAHSFTDNRYSKDVVFDASKSNTLYGKSNTVQPQTVKYFVYIVVATSAKTDIQVDINEVATDLNGKAETDLSNVNASKSAKTEIVSWNIPDYTAPIDLNLTTSNQEYTMTAPSDGVVCALGFIVNGGANGYVRVNGTNVGYTYNNGSGQYNGTFSAEYVVGKGDIITAKSQLGSGACWLRFFPMKGVQ